MLSHRHFLIYVYTLEVGPFQSCFANYKIPSVHITLYPLLANPVHCLLTLLSFLCCSCLNRSPHQAGLSVSKDAFVPLGQVDPISSK